MPELTRPAALVLALLWAPVMAVADEAPRRIDLHELIALAQAGPRAEMARQDTERARARAGEAEAARYPRLSLTSFVAPSPDIDCQGSDCTRTTPEEVSLSVAGLYGGASLSAIQPVYTFGKLDAVTRAAHAGVRAMGHLEGALAGDIALEAARAYHGLKLARELVWMLEDGLAEIEKAVVRIDERIAEGTGEATVQDRLRVETLQAEVAARLSEAREAEAVALAGVRALTGEPSIDIDDAPLEPVALELGAVEDYAARARERRPELGAARAGADAARALGELASAGYFPDLVLVGALGIARAQGVDDPPSAFANDPFNATTAAVALALRWQLDPMAQRARVAQARAESRRAQALVELAEQAAGFDVRAAHAQARQARERLQAAERGAQSARSWMAAVLQADAVGAAEAKDLADAFIAYFTLRARHATSVFEWNLATVRLGRAAGEFALPRARR